MELMTEFSQIATENGFYIDTCAETADFSSLGIKHACCIVWLYIQHRHRNL
ncbi:MAG: hypothetical protein ACI4EF_09080 [Coprococcus sp.]